MAPKPGRSSIGVRVRPNANDFVKDLERQLQGKKQTYWVNVHADMKPANKDIGEWARGPLKKIRASVPVGANMLPATTQLADWRRKQAGNRTNIPIGLKLDGAYSQLVTFRKVAGSDIEVKLKVNTESANRAAERFEQALARRGINVPFGIEVDGSQVDRAVSKAQRQAKDKPVKTALELEVDDAQRKLTALRIQEQAKKLGVKVDVDADATKANLQLKLLRARAAAQKIEMNVDVKRSGLDAFNKAISGIEKKLGGGSIIRSLDFGPLNLGKPGGLMGTLTTINLLAGAVPGAVFAVTGLSKAITDLAGAASIAPGALGGLLASIGTFTVGVSGMGDAFSALTDMWSETGSEAASTARRSVQANNQLRQSVRDEAQAQRDVASARREATNDLRNLNNELRGGVINEAQAILDLQKARDRYAQGGFDNATDERQAALDIVKAQDNITNVRERNNQLQQKANEEGAKGVENSDKVTQAQERVTRAAEATAQALEAIQSAQATGVMGKFQDEIDQLTPNARDFVMVLAGMRGPLLDLRNDVQETMFADSAPAFQQFLNNMLPVVGPGMQRIAGAMNKSLLQVFDSLGSEQGQSIIERILGGTAEAQEGITKLIDPLTRGLGTLMAAGAEHLPQVVDLFTRLADRFANFIEEADANGSLDAFMDRGIGALEKMAELGINLIQIINNLGGAFEGDMLQGLVDVTQKFEDWIVSAEGQQKINQWIQDAKDLWEDWKPVLQDLPEIFDAVSGAAKNLIDAITPFLNLFTSVMKEAPGLVQGFVGVWLGSKLITGFLSPVASLMGGILKGFRALPGLAAAAANLPGVLGNVAASVPGAAAGAGGAGTTLGTVAAAATPFVAVTSAFLLAGQALYDRASDEDKQVAGTNITTDDIANSRTGGRGTSASNAHPVQRIDPNKPPAFGTAEYGFLADAVKAGKFKEQFPNIGVGQDGHLVDTSTGQVLPGFMAGGYNGYTDWGSKSGRLIEAHGGEYIEPKPTVDHYGVDAMRAVHNKRATISYEVGGGVPMANPNWEIHGKTKKPVIPRPANMGPSIEAQWGPDGMPTYRIPDSAREGARPGQAGGYENIPGWTTRSGVQGNGAYPFLPGTKINPGFGGGGVGGSLGSFEGGGLVWDPNTGQYVESGAAIEHGQNTSGAQAGPSILDTVSSGVTQGITHGLNVATQVAGQVQGIAQGVGTGPAPGPGGSFADIATGGAAGGAAPGPTLNNTLPGIPGTVGAGGGLFDSFLGSLGIPGLGGSQQQTGPGWGPGGAPMGLGGGEGSYDANGQWVPPLDIRKFGIGPGPIGSGPADWAAFTGSTLGKFGSGLVTTFAQGVLDFAGLGGITSSPYFQAAGGVGGHFLGADQKDSSSSVQAPGAADANAQATDLIDQALNMPLNPADINAAPSSLPAAFDPNSGSALPNVSGNPKAAGNGGLQKNTLRGKAIIQAKFPWATNIGGVRPDEFKWHPNGLALDVMTDPGHGNNDPSSPEGLRKGNQLYAWLNANKAALGIDYLLWQEKDHYNHIHVNFAASGYPDGSGVPGVVTTDPGGSGGTASKGGWGNWKPAPKPAPPKKPSSGGLFGPAIGGNPPPGATMVPSFLPGGFNAGAVIIPPKPAPPARPPNAIQMQPKVTPPVARPAPTGPTPSAPSQAKPAAPTAPGVAAPPPAPHGAPGVAGAPPGPSGAPGVAPTVQPAKIGTGPGPSESGDHVHPALRKGIKSGFAAAGQAAATALSIAASIGGGAPVPGASAAGALGAMAPYIQGLFDQAGKITTNVANVASSFLVGNLTNGETDNPYGVTQRGSNPTGGTRIVDNSQKYGDVYTQSPREFFKQLDIREAQKSQGSLGGYDRYA